ncbi:MAG: SRPBCC family protein, partial [Bacteroidota bacterium]
MRNGIVTSAISVKETINIPTEPAWEILSAFKGIEEFSPIAKSHVEGKGVGAKRICIMPDGMQIKELLTKVDHDLMEMEYQIIEVPLPIENYRTVLRVTPKSSDSCEIHYSSSYHIEKQHQEA